jgi:hypothetical protein
VLEDVIRADVFHRAVGEIPGAAIQIRHDVHTRPGQQVHVEESFGTFVAATEVDLHRCIL